MCSGKVDQADIGKVYMGQRARIVVESYKDKRFDGEVTKISPLGVEKDNVTTFEVRVSIRNPGGVLKANMSANAEIILEEKQKFCWCRRRRWCTTRAATPRSKCRISRRQDRQTQSSRKTRHLERRQNRTAGRV